MVPPPWLDELVVTPGPPWHAMATRAIARGAWLLPPDEHTARELARKDELLRTAHDVVAARSPGAEPDEVEARTAGLVAPGTATLDDAARRVPEDLCLLRRGDGGWRLVAGVVCFPSMWRIADKVGHRLTDVHEPVPAYAEELAARVDRLLDGLRGDRPVWRRNWFVHDTDELHLPDPPAAPPYPLDAPGGLWLRSEHQTLRRVSDDAIVFTIRTQQAPLASIASRGDVAAAMAAAIRSWPPDLDDYRGADRWREPVLSWLDELISTA